VVDPDLDGLAFSPVRARPSAGWVAGARRARALSDSTALQVRELGV